MVFPRGHIPIGWPRPNNQGKTSFRTNAHISFSVCLNEDRGKKPFWWHLPVQSGLVMCDVPDPERRWVCFVIEVHRRVEEDRLVGPVIRVLDWLTPGVNPVKEWVREGKEWVIICERASFFLCAFVPFDWRRADIGNCFRRMKSWRSNEEGGFLFLAKWEFNKLGKLIVGIRSNGCAFISEILFSSDTRRWGEHQRRWNWLGFCEIQHVFQLCRDSEAFEKS